MTGNLFYHSTLVLPHQVINLGAMLRMTFCLFFGVSFNVKKAHVLKMVVTALITLPLESSINKTFSMGAWAFNMF